MFKTVTRKETRQSRIRRIRAKIKVTAQRPRLCVHRSLAHISVQLIDDLNGKTLASANDKGLTGTPTEKAQAVGKKIAEQAKGLNITAAVFDRAGYKYHGRVAVLAAGVREAGLIV